MRFLFTDDEISDLESIQNALEAENHECLLFTNPHDGLMTFQNEKYDTVITDYKLSEMKGLDVLKVVRKLNQNVPGVILTENEEDDNSLKGSSLTSIQDTEEEKLNE